MHEVPDAHAGRSAEARAEEVVDRVGANDCARCLALLTPLGWAVIAAGALLAVLLGRVLAASPVADPVRGVQRMELSAGCAASVKARSTDVTRGQVRNNGVCLVCASMSAETRWTTTVAARVRTRGGMDDG